VILAVTIRSRRRSCVHVAGAVRWREAGYG